MHLLGGLDPGDARAHQRLVHVKVKQADFSVSDAGHRLAVDADELQQRDKWESRLEHRVDVTQELDLVLGDSARALRADAESVDEPLNQSLFEPGLACGLSDRHSTLVGREELLEEAEGQAPLVGGARDAGERVPALAHPRHHSGGPDG